VVSIAADLLGLDMKFQEAPRTSGEIFSGSEFLKHMLVPLKYKVNGHVRRSIFPVQLPSRVYKWGCANVESDKATRPDMSSHIGGVALGQVPFLLEPFITGPFVDGWKSRGKKHRVPAWVNIIAPPNKEDQLALPAGVSDKQWMDACAEVMVARYGTTRTELETAQKLVRKHAGQMGAFEGGLFARMVDRDYAGEYLPT
jgi:hypothetical protein